MRTSKKARALADKVEGKIRFEPDLHKQDMWITKTSRVDGCDTTACVAGWAVLLSGLQPCFTEERNDCHLAWFVTESSEPYKMISISSEAKQRLGLSMKEAEWLFDAYRRRDEVLAGLAAVREGDTAKFKEVMKGDC